jgi:hypothetical protein
MNTQQDEFLDLGKVMEIASISEPVGKALDTFSITSRNTIYKVFFLTKSGVDGKIKDVDLEVEVTTI